MALGTEVGLSPGHTVLDENPAPPNGAQRPCDQVSSKPAKDANCHGLIAYDTLGFILSQLHPLNARL